MDLKKIFLRYGLFGKKSIYLYNGIKVQGGFRMKKISKYIIAAVTAAVFMLSACSKTDGETAETTSEASAAASSESYCFGNVCRNNVGNGDRSDPFGQNGGILQCLGC